MSWYNEIQLFIKNNALLLAYVVGYNNVLCMFAVFAFLNSCFEIMELIFMRLKFIFNTSFKILVIKIASRLFSIEIKEKM